MHNKIKMENLILIHYQHYFVIINFSVPNQTMTPHDYQGPNATMPGTTTGSRPVLSTLTYTHSMQPPHPPFCEYDFNFSAYLKLKLGFLN